MSENVTRIFKVAEKTSLMVKALVNLANRMDMNTAQLEQLILENS